jgi:hypothetical protein
VSSLVFNGTVSGMRTGKASHIRGLSEKHPTLDQENKVLYLGGYNT